MEKGLTFADNIKDPLRLPKPDIKKVPGPTTRSSACLSDANAAAMATTTVGSVMTATFSDASKFNFKLAATPRFTSSPSRTPVS